MAPPNPDNPLSQYTKLSSSIYIREPTTPTNNHATPYPKTIVLSFWMNAPPRTLAKYVKEYNHLVPTARIIIILSTSVDFILRSTQKAQAARLAPAISALCASTAPVFIHMFSNGGAFTTTNLLQGYQAATGKPLRVSSTVLDSAPGTATVGGGLRAFSFVLPRVWVLRVVGQLMLWLFLVATAMVGAVFGVEDG
ncbi:hypothetical protein BBP40_008671, partial [Aspergillus hancockii]